MSEEYLIQGQRKETLAVTLRVLALVVLNLRIGTHHSLICSKANEQTGETVEPIHLVPFVE